MPELPGRRARSGGAVLLVLLGIMVGATCLRFAGLDRREAWLDENCTFFLVDQFPEWGAVGARWRSEVAHLPYMLLLTGWSAVFGDSMWTLRAWSALVGTVTVATVAVVAAGLAGRRAGVVAALLLAVHPLHIYYSQEARVYATWVLAIAGCLYALFRAARNGRTTSWVLFAFLSVFTVLVHYHTLFWLPFTFLAALIAEVPRNFLKRWLVVMGLLAPVLAGIVWLLVIPLGGSGPRWWLVSLWSDQHPFFLVARSLWVMLPSGTYPNYLGPLTFAAQESDTVLGALATRLVRWTPIGILGGAILANRLIPPRRGASGVADGAALTVPADPRKAVLWLVGQSIGYLLAIWTYSWVVDPAYVVARYDLAALPAVVMVMALLMDGLFELQIGTPRVPDTNHVERPLCRGRRAGVVAIGLLCLCSLLTIYVARSAPVRQDMRTRVQRIASAVGPGDLVLTLGGYRWFIEYEWKQAGLAADMRSFPPWHDGQLCWDNPQAELADPERLEMAVDRSMKLIRSAQKGGRRIFLLVHGEAEGPRWEIDRLLFAALSPAEFDILPVDEWSGLVEIRAILSSEP